MIVTLQALAAAEDDFVAVCAAEVAFDLDEQPGVAETDAITRRRAEQTNVFVP
jgi:hypothetical protein